MHHLGSKSRLTEIGLGERDFNVRWRTRDERSSCSHDHPLPLLQVSSDASFSSQDPGLDSDDSKNDKTERASCAAELLLDVASEISSVRDSYI